MDTSKPKGVPAAASQPRIAAGARATASRVPFEDELKPRHSAPAATTREVSATETIETAIENALAENGLTESETRAVQEATAINLSRMVLQGGAKPAKLDRSQEPDFAEE